MAADITARLAFDSIRVYVADHLHLDVRRSEYRGLQAWYWDGNYKIEITVAGADAILLEYTDRAMWVAVLSALEKLPLSGD